MGEGKRGRELLLELKRIAGALEALAGTAGEGGGKAAACDEGRAFGWTPTEGLLPVRRPARTEPALLVGIDEQKEAFYANMGRFLEGRPCLDVLLWGERGTGKTSLAGSLLQAFPGSGWGIVHVRETHVPSLPRLLDLLEADGRRWVVFFDDLNLTGSGDDYHELKVFLEGGLSARPENTCALATSNRRHIVPERFADQRTIHPEEDTAETISLADRFGLSLGFYAMDQDTYLAAVASQLLALGFSGEEREWRVEALRFAMERGIRSGRSAAQFARFHAGST